MVLTYLEVISGNDGGQKARISIFCFPVDGHIESMGVMMVVFVL